MEKGTPMTEKEDFLHLQNGSDVRGVALQEPDGPAVTLTGEYANRIAGGFSVWLSHRLGKSEDELRVGVGHDSRLTAEALKEAIAQGMSARGVTVYDCGLASTPAMFMGTVFPETAYDGGIMITASHLPQNRNGMKFFTHFGGLEKQDITDVLTIAAETGETTEKSQYVTPDLIQGRVSPLMKLYAAFLRNKIVEGVGASQTPLSNLHIVVDAGNGAGGFFVQSVLEPLGADCSGSQFLEPDGHFPNHQPNPENNAAMESICSAVTANKAGLGIIFDTDVDRMSAVLSDGRDINRNALIAIMAAILAPEYPEATIVTDSITSDRLTSFLEEKLGLHHHCFKRGYRNVINEAIRLNGEGTLTPLAIETSGHGALKENYFLDDGAYMAVRLIIAAAKAACEGNTLDALLDGFTSAEHECELRISIAGSGFGDYGREVISACLQRAEAAGIVVVPSHEGLRLSFPGVGWLMLRVSLHDPILPLNAEAGTAEGLEEILVTAKKLLDGFDRLEILW
jgi:phosphomannomutase